VKIVLDTNVFVSGVFFGGPPGEILAEYERVTSELAARFPNIDPAPFLALVALNAELRDCPPLHEQACADADDDKFLACALATCSECIVSGDRLLLKASGYQGVEVIRPRDFVDRHLQ